MKKLILTALSLSILTSAAYAAGPNSGREAGYRPVAPAAQAEALGQESLLKAQAVAPQKATREELDEYAGRAIKANPENYRTKK
ncbi:hypothetical protein [Pseudogulbenkiania sp. MAI-1]|uniref:hypothetical protein n=1 Tax=Pseudogulbenkiania sp. MAI-1 TaxID=990370 RepID=UPI00045E5D86|nr:hypothetical protein [Pseudogulbenkiania sp. MAI-1]